MQIYDQCYLKELSAGTEVTSIELVGHIPANGTKLAALLYYAVQEAHDKQQLSPLLPARTQGQCTCTCNSQVVSELQRNSDCDNIACYDEQPTLVTLAHLLTTSSMSWLTH